MIFSGTYEYPIALIILMLLRPGPRSKSDIGWVASAVALTILVGFGVVSAGMLPSPSRTALTIGLPIIIAFLSIDRPYRYGFALGGVLLAVKLMGLASGGSVLYAKRSFFGVHRIVESPSGNFRSLIHGVTIHGRQSKKEPETPLTYYFPNGPIGQLVTELNSAHPMNHVGVVGLGIGSLAAYARPHDEYRFFEIDPVVIEVASDPKWFSFIAHAKGKVSIVEGDARLTMAKEPKGSYDLIVVDAFSSDAIPMHLLTLEALRLYVDRLKPNGVLAMHISNRYLRLQRVLASASDELHLTGLLAYDTEISDDDKARGKEASEWFVMGRNEESLKPAPRSMFESISDVRRVPVWTDSRSNMLEAWGPD
jgi:SAM-dependent methyltransferase